MNALSLQTSFCNQTPPCAHLLLDLARGEASRALGHHDPGAARDHVLDDPVAVIGRVCAQRAELDALDERGRADRVVAVARQQRQPRQVSERVGEGEDLGGPAGCRRADGLVKRPPFAPCA